MSIDAPFNKIDWGFDLIPNHEKLTEAFENAFETLNTILISLIIGVAKMQDFKDSNYLYWTESFIKAFKMRLLKRRNKLLQLFVIYLNISFLCHHLIIVEAKASSQVTTNKGETGLSDIFSKYDTNEDGEYYYDDDDPYGIGASEDGNEYADDDYYSYEDSEGSENSPEGNEFSSKSGKDVL